MRNKVVITGINTSELKVIPHEMMVDLLRKAHEGDLNARDALVEGNLKLVLSVVKRFNNRSDDLDDLFQVGSIGLMKAIDNFDTELGLKFSTYAVPMIIGEIRRFLRDNSKIRVSRSLKDIAYKTLKFKEEYNHEHHTEPTLEIISETLGFEPIDIIMALEAVLDPVSIYTPVYNGGGDEIYLMDQISDGNHTEEERINNLIIEEGLEKLNPRLKNIILERYYNNKTQVEIAKELGISQAQVSRLEKSALSQILEK